MPDVKKFTTSISSSPEEPDRASFEVDVSSLPPTQPYESIRDVPKAVREQVRRMLAAGVDEIYVSQLLGMPGEWVRWFKDEVEEGDGAAH